MTPSMSLQLSISSCFSTSISCIPARPAMNSSPSSQLWHMLLDSSSPLQKSPHTMQLCGFESGFDDSLVCCMLLSIGLLWFVWDLGLSLIWRVARGDTLHPRPGGDVVQEENPSWRAIQEGSEPSKGQWGAPLPHLPPVSNCSSGSLLHGRCGPNAWPFDDLWHSLLSTLSA